MVITAQPGIFAQGTRSHYHLEFDSIAAIAPARVSEALRGIGEPAVTSGGANIVIGFGSDLWAHMASQSALSPHTFVPFREIVGVDGMAAPATQHDLWVWIHGTGPDVVLDTARAIRACLAGVATLAAEQPCFVFKDSRDLTGFIDGTANPVWTEAPEVAVIRDGEPGAGGSFVLAQRWVHDLAAFEVLGVDQQEAVIGRTKADSVELGVDVKPSDSHIARVEIEDDDGVERPIYRRSTPFGTVHEQGLYFLAFSADLDRFDTMLARMFGIASDSVGVRDRLTDFSRPVSGAYYFAPSLSDLRTVLDDHS